MRYPESHYRVVKELRAGSSGRSKWRMTSKPLMMAVQPDWTMYVGINMSWSSMTNMNAMSKLIKK